MKKTSLIVATLLIAAVPASAQDAVDAATAEAPVIDVDGNELGTLSLVQTDTGVSIAGVLTGLPVGDHAFHIHETGACSTESGFASAGGHFAPRGNAHGFEAEGGPHAGDMLNQTVDANGEMVVNVLNDRVSLLNGDEGDVFDADGSAIVVHAGTDDYKSQPSGDAGDRIACGVIERTL